MTCEHESLINKLLDGEASPEEVLAALDLLDNKPELMAFYQRQQWLRAHWQKEYLGEPVDLSQGVWDALDQAATSEDGVDVVDELALRREAKQQAIDPKQPMEQNSQETAPSSTPVFRHWWRGLAQGAVAAMVCLVVVGLYRDFGAHPGDGQPQLAVDHNNSTQVASTFVPADDRLYQDRLQRSAAQLVVAGQEEPLAKGSMEAGLLLASDSGEGQFVSLEKLREQERARLATYYMMHTGNSALIQPQQSVQLVRIVDTPLLHNASHQGASSR